MTSNLRYLVATNIGEIGAYRVSRLRISLSDRGESGNLVLPSPTTQIENSESRSTMRDFKSEIEMGFGRITVMCIGSK